MTSEAIVNILLVDDSRNNLLALEAMLESLGHNLVKATSGEEALRSMLTQDFAVIILDVKMPGMDGFALAKLIRQRPTSQHTPIIFVTGNYRNSSDLERGYSLGAVDYLFKPIIPEILLSKVAVFVSLFQKNAQSQLQAEQLKIANEKLEAEIAKRKLAQSALRQANQELEIKVQERTGELAQLNESLKAEIIERKFADERLKIALQNSPTVVFNQDTDLRYTWIYNPPPGLSIEQIVGKLDAEIFSLEDAQRLTAIKRSVLITGKGKREETFLSIAGEIHYYDLTVEPLRNESGEIVGITSAAIDITELRAREIKLRAIFENALEAITIMDDHATYVESNPAACEMFGLPLTELLGKRMADFMEHSFDFELTWRNFQQQGQAMFEVRLLRPDGTVRIVESACKANFLTGRHLSILRDITERKQAEETQLALEAEKELRRLQLRFFTMASHEFRTPLSSIIGSAQLLKSCLPGGTPEKRLRNIQRIEVAAQKLTQLLESLLTINRAETGKLDFHPSQIDLEKICIELVEEMQVKYSSNYQINFVRKGKYPKRCLDEKLLRYILSNLLLNAIKYSPQGSSINFDLYCEKSETVFKIKDEGIGIYPEDQEHLFELFHRGVNVENIPGTGLGLSVVKKCLDLQGGTISVASEVGVGTTVTVTIPKNY
jgi:PAS domain S-box-containing protein